VDNNLKFLNKKIKKKLTKENKKIKKIKNRIFLEKNKVKIKELSSLISGLIKAKFVN